MMDATYGAVRPFSPAWAQRSVLDATSNSDFFGRLAYYEEMRAAGQPRGAIFAAERESDGALCGFADVGVSLWLPNDRAFRRRRGRRERTDGAVGGVHHKLGEPLRVLGEEEVGVRFHPLDADAGSE